MLRLAHKLWHIEFDRIAELGNNPEAVTGRSKQHAIANMIEKRLIQSMKFVAHLFLRQILPLRDVTSVMEALLSGRRVKMINCLIALLCECGFALEGDLQKSGHDTIMDGIISKLSSLLEGESLLEKRTRSAIAKLLVLRKKGWKQKIAKRGDAGDVVYVEEVVGARPGPVCGSPEKD